VRNKETSQLQLKFPDFSADVRLRPEPFLKWAGGKGQLLSQLEPLFPKTFGRYYEPFLGGGSVFFHLLPGKATLNDFNPNLIAAYCHIQGQLEVLLTRLYDLKESYYSLADEAREQRFYDLRTQYNQLGAGTVEKTALLIFLNKTAYNGLYRESKKGGFNVPFGRYTKPGIFDEANLRAVSIALQPLELLTGNFRKAVTNAQKGDFIYFDPPYLPLNKTSSFTSYTSEAFGEAQQIELARLVRELANRGVLIMLSNSSVDFIRDLYHDFNQYEVKANRMINSKAEARGKISELVITSY